MKTHLLVLVLCICSTQMFYSQEDDGVVSLALPIRNSLTFNQFAINPTFSFVREQNKYVSLYTKREWVQFDDAPLTYLVSYSGRFRENMGVGVGLFQQNYGVLTTFGGILNFAYNARLDRDSNLTFGMNLGAYKSGINSNNVITNMSDPSLENIPSNLLFTINPGINYGNTFLDFGVSINNLVLYNINTSELIENNPEQSIQAHLMYTGYMNSAGFFDESKFSGLVKSEFKEDNTIISGIAMVTVPKGIWAQVGYNTLYGASGGLGMNISTQISIEYSFEKALGDLSDFGPSHEITLAYRFKNDNNYDYSGDDQIGALIPKSKKRKPVSSISKAEAEANRKLSTEAKLAAALKAKEDAEAEAQAKLIAEEKANEEAELQAKLLAERKAKEEADAQARLIAEQKAQEEADAQAKLLEEQRAKAKAEAEARAKIAADNKAKAEAQAIILAEQKAKEDAEAQARLIAEQKAQEEADVQARLLAEQKAQEEADAQARLLAEQKALEEAEAQAKLLAEQKAKEELISNPKDEIGKSMNTLDKQTKQSNTTQNELLKRFDEIVEIKNKDLKDLKEENDLSEQGIAVGPKPFKSISAENNALNAIKSDLDNVINSRNEKIAELRALYDDKYKADTLINDEVYLYYKNTIKRLTSEQLKAMEARAQLETRLDDIKIATDFERRRRIKRAAFDSEEERYTQDRATLQNIKQTTIVRSSPLKSRDLDFGEEQSSNIQILKNVKNVENGYYLILAVHSDVNKRNDFITKLVASGRTDIDFFYDINTSKYYIYYDKLDSIEAANEGLKSKGNTPYNIKMSLVKIEN